MLPSVITAVGASAGANAFWKHAYQPILGALTFSCECLAVQPDGSPALSPAIVAALARAITRVAAFGYGNHAGRFEGTGGWDRPASCLDFSPIVTGCVGMVSHRHQVLQAAEVINRALRAGNPAESPGPDWLDLLLWSCRFFATLRTLRVGFQLHTVGGHDVAPRLAQVTHEAMESLAAAVHALPDEALRTVDIRSATMATFCMSEVR